MLNAIIENATVLQNYKHDHLNTKLKKTIPVGAILLAKQVNSSSDNVAPQWRELILFVFVSEVGNVFSPPTKAGYPLEHVCGIFKK